MSKKPKRRKNSSAFPPPNDSDSKPKNQNLSRRPVKWDLVIIFLVIAIGGSILAVAMRPGPNTPRFTYTVTDTFPHDKTAFTQGLVADGETLWISTGKYGESTVRKTELKTGKVLKQVELPEKFFGEGLVKWKDRLIQLTWKEGTAFVYDLELNKVDEFKYEGHGWGLTHDGQNLIMSDGTAQLRFLDPETFEVKRTIWVREGRRSVSKLNELEFVNGNIYANEWTTDLIYEIDPADGSVQGIIDLTGMWPSRERPTDGLLNGIAFNEKTNRLLVTGKLCPKIFEVELKLKEQ